MSPSREEATDILFSLANAGHSSPFSVTGLANRVRQDWPNDFSASLPSPDGLIGRACEMSPRDWHVACLVAELNRSPRDDFGDNARLRYHARWLSFLGSGDPKALPLVSVVIPVLDRGSLIESLIANCSAQTYRNVELVIVDDGSTDDTWDQLQKYAGQFKLIRHSQNRGLSAARNSGVAAASGELVHFLDSDDLLHRSHISAKVAAFAAIPDVNLCVSRATDVALFYSKPSDRPHFGFLGHVKEGVTPMSNMLDFCIRRGTAWSVSSTTLPRFALIAAEGVFDNDLRAAEDVRFWFRLALNEPKVSFLDRPLVDRIHMSDGMTRSSDLIASSVQISRLRFLYDLVREPKHWVRFVEYMSTEKIALILTDIPENVVHADGFCTIVTAAAQSAEVVPAEGRSALLLLVFLWMVCERQKQLSSAHTQYWDRLSLALVRAFRDAGTLAPGEVEEWQNRANKLSTTKHFAEIVSVDGPQTLPEELSDKVNATVQLLQSIAAVKTGNKRRAVALSTPSEPKIASIVVPVLADVESAERTIASCVNVSHNVDVEIFVVETDVARCNHWRDWPDVTLLRHSGDLVGALATGLRFARNEFVRFLKPGDLLSSTALARQIEISKRLTGPSIVSSTDAFIGLDDPPSTKLSMEIWKREAIPPLFELLFPRSVFSRLGGFDIALGDAFQERLFFRLATGGVDIVLGYTARGDLRQEVQNKDGIAIAALSNLSHCLREKEFFAYIPRAIRPFGEVDNAISEADPGTLMHRCLEMVWRDVAELNRRQPDALVPALSMCVLGIIWGRTKTGNKKDCELTPFLTAVLDAASDTKLDLSGERFLCKTADAYIGERYFDEALQYAGRFAEIDPGNPIATAFRSLA